MKCLLIILTLELGPNKVADLNSCMYHISFSIKEQHDLLMWNIKLSVVLSSKTNIVYIMLYTNGTIGLVGVKRLWLTFADTKK